MGEYANLSRFMQTKLDIFDYIGLSVVFVIAFTYHFTVRYWFGIAILVLLAIALF